MTSTVTQVHIRHRDELLDSNMPHSKKRTFNTAVYQSDSHIWAKLAGQHEHDNRRIKVNGSRRTIHIKANILMNNAKNQISLQQAQLQHMQNDRIVFRRQEMEYFRQA